MNTSRTIVFFGTDDFSAISLRKLLDGGFNVVGVVTKPDARKGRGKKIIAPLVKQIALEHGLKVWQPTKLMDIYEDLNNLRSNQQDTQEVIRPTGVLVSYGKIIPQKIIDLFEPGIINVHPSLLPVYRGPSPVETAILNGDKKTGVSIMQLSADMDAGPVYDQVIYTLDGQETAPELAETLGEIGAQRLQDTLGAIINGGLTPTPQDDKEATYCHLLSKDDTFLKPSTLTAAQAWQKVKAHLIFPKTKYALFGQEIVITKAEVVDSDSVASSPEKDLTPLDIKCKDNNYLRILELIGPSGKAMDAKAFLNGYKK